MHSCFEITKKGKTNPFIFTNVKILLLYTSLYSYIVEVSLLDRDIFLSALIWSVHELLHILIAKAAYYNYNLLLRQLTLPIY